MDLNLPEGGTDRYPHATMRSARQSARHFHTRSATAICTALLLPFVFMSSRAASPAAVHLERYAMGTMFDIVAYHSPPSDAQRAMASAMDEIARLDQVLSHFKADSDLSKLVRDGRSGFVSVDASLFEVIQQSVEFSRRSGGKFDVTIAPLLRTWKQAAAEGHRPSDAAVAAARRCVGFEKIEMQAPDRIRFRSDCLEIDLGGIGKGYAVDRAVAILKAAGIRRALINAGGSSIASIGAPPDESGWPVRLGATVSGRTTLLLRDTTISTSQQRFVPLAFDSGVFGEILDPQAGKPTESRMTVSVVAPSATVSDALSTTLLLLPAAHGAKLLEEFAGVSAIWVGPSGDLEAEYGTSRLQLSDKP
jgi:FAD:protein FMN transferase